MSEHDVQIVNPNWHDGCKLRIDLSGGGAPKVICEDCAAICTIADTWHDAKGAMKANGAHCDGETILAFRRPHSACGHDSEVTNDATGT